MKRKSPTRSAWSKAATLQRIVGALLNRVGGEAKLTNAELEAAEARGIEMAVVEAGIAVRIPPETKSIILTAEKGWN